MTTNIPFGDLSRVYRRLQPQIDAATHRVFERGWFILGPEVEAFETAFAAYCEVPHAVGVANGTDAIELALRALGIGPGDEVITSPLSATFSALAISRIGAVPTFADIDPVRYTLDPALIEAAITPRTRAVMPVHLYGQPADMAPILEIADRRGLVVVEDCAQAHGACYRDRRVGSLGHAAAFSFYPSKNLGAFGDGGLVTTSDPAIAERLRMLRHGGQRGRYEHEIVGVNSRLDEVQAAILAVRLGTLDEDNARRREIAGRYGICPSPLGRDDSNVGLVRRPWVAPDVEHAFHLYVVRCSDRDQVARHLTSRGVQTAVHYPTAIHMQPAYGGLANAGRYPEAERAAAKVLSIPIYPELTDDEIGQVAAALTELAGNP